MWSKKIGFTRWRMNCIRHGQPILPSRDSPTEITVNLALIKITFWLAATWALRSLRLSCRFLVPLLPGYLPGAISNSVTPVQWRRKNHPVQGHSVFPLYLLLERCHFWQERKISHTCLLPTGDWNMEALNLRTEKFNTVWWHVAIGLRARGYQDQSDWPFKSS